jgi:hypothetical protein
VVTNVLCTLFTICTVVGSMWLSKGMLMQRFLELILDDFYYPLLLLGSCILAFELGFLIGGIVILTL